MTAYNFKEQFIRPILDGTKHQTIRAPRLGRAGHVNPGHEMQLYTGLRAKHCRLIARVICTARTLIKLNFDPYNGNVGAFKGELGEPVADLDRFAISDGFQNWTQMVHFWTTHNHPDRGLFYGFLIEWEPIRHDG